MKDRFSALLRTRSLGREHAFFDTIDSTQTQAAALATRGAGHGTLVHAREQTSGRGRAGRLWVSGTGSLCFSVVLKEGVVAAEAFQWSFVAGLAVHDVISARTALSPRLKWPNDVLVNRKKVAGVLCTLELAPTPSVIVGVGVNLAFDPASVDGSLAPRATTLAAADDPADWLAALLLALEARADAHLTGARHTLAAFRERMAFVGESVEVTTQSATFRGTCLGVDEGFELILQDTAGARHTIAAADVWPVERRGEEQ